MFRFINIIVFIVLSFTVIGFINLFIMEPDNTNGMTVIVMLTILYATKLAWSNIRSKKDD